jgi:hypothetical protein
LHTLFTVKRERERDGEREIEMLRACKGVDTLFTGQRERERDIKREREKKR